MLMTRHIMKNRGWRVVGMGIPLLGVFLLGFMQSVAFADVSASLVRKLASPVGKLLMGSTAEGRALMKAVLGEEAVLLPQQSLRWQTQTTGFVEGLGSPMAEEVYLRVLRSELKLRDQLGAESSLFKADGGFLRQLTSEELLALMRVAHGRAPAR